MLRGVFGDWVDTLQRGVERNLSMSIDWHRAAVREGNPDSMYELGLAYSAGEGVEQNDRTAYEWFERAARQRHSREFSPDPRF